ncbi:MAG: 30S ribosomal protein S9 [Candidatus Moranbacteria bacterium]|nr:30S ribosomal protein S9 [Candidatus Moranbacteria bacterium]
MAGKYFYAVGRRKTSVAQVRLFEDDKAQDTDLIINDKKMKDYFPTISLQNNMLQPLKAVGMHGKFTMTVLVRGGGVTGQVEAVRLGIARALVEFNAEFKKSLKDLGLMTRDAREVERKKAGLKKARKAPQWAKR